MPVSLRFPAVPAIHCKETVIRRKPPNFFRIHGPLARRSEKIAVRVGQAVKILDTLAWLPSPRRLPDRTTVIRMGPLLLRFSFHGDGCGVDGVSVGTQHGRRVGRVA